MKGGFSDSAVRLNKYVREQEKWTATEIEARGNLLVELCLVIWPGLVVAPALVQAARKRDLQRRAAESAGQSVKMSDQASVLFRGLKAAMSNR